MKAEISNIIEKSLQISAPSWPLQNTVAVNPFWFLKHKSFHHVANELSSIFKTSLYMPFDYYREAWDSGEITKTALEESIRLNAIQNPTLPRLTHVFMNEAQKLNDVKSGIKTIDQLLSRGRRDINAQVIMDFGKYASAYLDEKQAISTFPWKNETFWEAWLQAQELDRSMEIYGFKNFKKSLSSFSGLDAESGISFMLEKLGIKSEQDKITYMQTLIASVLGWLSQFKYVEWQKQLGYVVTSKASAIDALAVRMAYDFGIYKSQEDFSSETKILWQNEWNKAPEKDDKIKNASLYLQVLQLALEISYQQKLASKIHQNILSHAGGHHTKAQILFCIDVRSEMIRRNIEDTNPSIKTIGFAGFFGVPFSYTSHKESKPSLRLPVLLTPAFQVEEVQKTNTNLSRFSFAWLQVSSYFRNLRKNPLSSFLYVELFGALYIEKALRRSFLNVIEKLKGKQVPQRFKSHGFVPCQSKVIKSDGSILNLAEKIERAESVLRHMGLVNYFAKLVLILGHGSVTTNNAFGSSLDCGACGGHAGDINARFLADLLNDLNVREGLIKKGITIPSSTQFIAGVHETVTDEIFILEPEKVNKELRSELNFLMEDLSKATSKTQKERFLSRPTAMIPKTETRSKNWSEVRPEWGLAGNACFIVAPRSRTAGINLDGRSFLHDYDWRLDQAQGFKTLELIMTAPMIVTNWINLQYFASTVAPKVFGSGNKVLHNLVNETGVYEGNGGDLRVGLPIQSIHDGFKFVHEPLRLSVFIEAPREQIELLIAKHEVVKQLIENEWLHLIHIDSASLKSERRISANLYLPL